MNKATAIVLLVIFAICLIFLIKVFIPVFTNALKQLPKGIFIIIIIVIIMVMIYLVRFLINDESGGYSGENDDNTETVSEDNQEDIISETIDNCIILRNDEIWVDNQQVDLDKMKQYIDERVENNVPIILVDDYSTAVLFHEIIEICDEKGVNYTKKDETWLNK